ncbi:MAG: HdeD family acid-resistance protein [Gammaproteobacteria bacterium]
MMQKAHTEDFDQFLPQRKAILIRGILMMLVGSLLTFMTLLTLANPDTAIMSLTNGWLPIVAIFIIIIGFLECIDTFMTRHSKEYFFNLQFAIIDIVVGFFLLFEQEREPSRIILLVAAFLLIKGIFRVVAAYSVQFPNATSATTGGLISISLGIMLWQQWPSTSFWFISLCLCIDIVTRGWALTRFGIWLKALEKKRQESIDAD